MRPDSIQLLALHLFQAHLSLMMISFDHGDLMHALFDTVNHALNWKICIHSCNKVLAEAGGGGPLENSL